MDLFIRVILAAQPWKQDVTLTPLPWRDVDDRGWGAGFEGWSGRCGKLRIGVMWEDGVVRPVKPVRRALETMVRTLETHPGVELVDFVGESVAEIWSITVRSRRKVAFDSRTLTSHSRSCITSTAGASCVRRWARSPCSH